MSIDELLIALRVVVSSIILQSRENIGDMDYRKE